MLNNWFSSISKCCLILFQKFCCIHLHTRRNLFALDAPSKDCNIGSNMSHFGAEIANHVKQQCWHIHRVFWSRWLASTIDNPVYFSYNRFNVISIAHFMFHLRIWEYLFISRCQPSLYKQKELLNSLKLLGIN